MGFNSGFKGLIYSRVYKHTYKYIIYTHTDTHKHTHTHTHIYIYIYTCTRGSFKMFPEIFYF